MATIKDIILNVKKRFKVGLQYILTADAANPLTMNIFVTFFTIVFLAIVIVFLSNESPDKENSYYFRLIIDTYVPSIFTLCVSIIIQTFVEATQDNNTHFMLNLLALTGSFVYLFIYVLLPQSPSAYCLTGVLLESLFLLLVCLFAMKQILTSKNTDRFHIAANERRV